MSAKLIFLHSETFDLSGTRISENDQGNTSEVAKDMESSVRLNVTEESEMDGSTEPMVVRSDVEAQPADNSIQTERQQVERFNLGLHEMDSQEQLKAISDIEELRTSQHDPLGEFYEMETERGNVEVADAVNCSQEPLKAISDIEELRTSQHDPLGEFNEIETDRGFVEVADGVSGFLVNGLESLSATEPVSGDICNMPADDAVQPSLMDKTDDASASLQIDASCMSPDNKLDARTIEGDAFIVDMSNEKAIDAIEILEHGIEISAHLQSDCLEPAENIKASLASECHNLAFENGNQPFEEAGNDKPGALSEDGVLPADSNCDEKDPTSSFMCMGEIKIDSIHSVELDLDVNNPSLNVKEHTECQEADRISIMDGEVPVLDHLGGEDRSVSFTSFFLQQFLVNFFSWMVGLVLFDFVLCSMIFSIFFLLSSELRNYLPRKMQKNLGYILMWL
jgi:cohesin complex subunit SCC1